MIRPGASRALAALVLASAAPCSAQLPARWPRAPLTDVARAAVGAEVATERYGVSGRGAALCLVDTGADARHPELAGRVRWAHDPRAAPRARFDALEARFGGAVHGPDEPDRPGDPHGHGTAMAAIAAGTRGLAPDALLLVARAYDPVQGGFPDEAVVRAIGFCRAVAEEDEALDPRRLVVLLSLGGHDGGHDGRGAFERALEGHAGAVPIVVAAGNDGARAVRAAGRLFTGERGVVEVQVPRSGRADAELALTLRTRAPILLEGPDGTAVTLPSGAASLALPGADVQLEPVEGEPEVRRLRLVAREGRLEAGTYRLHLEGPGRFEVWLAGARLGPTFFTPALGGPHVQGDETITIPATAPRLVAVGATVARPEVQTRLGPIRTPGEAGARADFSSLGPSPGGAPKPDLAAPGGWILTALSGDVRDGDPDNLVGGALGRYLDEEGRVAVRGTSAAAAVVAGALLLAAELGPRAPDDARALLIASARGEGWSPGLGAGVLDVPRLLEAWSGATPERPASLVATRAFAPTDDALWVAARSGGEHLELELEGARHALALRHGTGEVAIPVTRARVGHPLVVRAWLDGAPLAPVVVPVVLERGPREAAGLGGGGCQASPGGRGALAAVLVFGAGRLWRARSSRARRRRGLGGGASC